MQVLDHRQVSRSNNIWVQTWVRQVCLKNASTKTTPIEKARPPAWDILTTPRSRTPCRIILGISSSWTPASGCDNQIGRKGGKEGERQPWVLIQSTRKQGAILHMHGYMCKKAISVDWTAECQNKRGIANPVEDYTSGHLHLAACRRE